ALEERGAETNRMAAVSAVVHTVSVSREGKVKLERVDIAHDTGFSLVNPLSVKKQLEGQIIWFYNDAMHQACTIKDGRIVENNFNKFQISHIDEAAPRSTSASSKPDTGPPEWATTASLPSHPRSATP